MADQTGGLITHARAVRTSFIPSSIVPYIKTAVQLLLMKILLLDHLDQTIHVQLSEETNLRWIRVSFL